MELVLERLGVDEDGNDIVTYAFAPATSTASTINEGSQS
jgi:hypothetical protein